MIQSMLSEIQTLLGQVATTAISSSSAGDDVFEVYAFSLVLEAARREGADIQYENVSGAFQGTCTFRTSPGHIWSERRPYTHAVLSLTGKPSLEAHLGVMLQGSSGTPHEADIAVIPRSEGLTCRLNRAEPRASTALLTIECKFYTTPLPLGMGRGFVGLAQSSARRRPFS